MILGISISDNRVLLAAREEADRESEYYQFDLPADFFDREGRSDTIWETADESIKNIYLNAERVVVGLPASICLAKRMELDIRHDSEKSDYRRWRAAIQLPGNLAEYEYGFVPIARSFDGTKEETIFFAVPARQVEKLKRAVFAEKTQGSVILIPEHIAFVELIRKSINKDDISQAAAVHMENDYCLAVLVKDDRFFRGRVFPVSRLGDDTIGQDVLTYLLCFLSPDEPAPLVITGRTDKLKIEWSPIITAFLDIKNLDFCVAWGLSEFAAAGGQCVLSAAS